MWCEYNPNPKGLRVGDCAIRAIAKATGEPWEVIYMALCIQGYHKGDLPNANSVWGSYLRSQGWSRHILPDTCPDCYTVRAFCEDHPYGKYILALSAHVVAVEDGNYYDAWDSGDEVPIYYWCKED